MVSKPLKRGWVFVAIVVVVVVGIFDYLTGFELNFFAFYLVPVTLAVWFVGRGFGIAISAFCVLISMSGDLIAGAHYSSLWVLAWNSTISLTFFLVVVWILDRLRSLQERLEERVRERTAALNKEMDERMRLEEEILSIAEKEQQRIGHDLHDTLCQHLTAVALAGKVLSERLEAKSDAEATAVNQVVDMVEGAIDLTRRLARGLHPADLSGEGFCDALQELAATIPEGFKTSCVFECDQQVEIPEPGVATHLYRIAQEATTNAIKHSEATRIVIRLKPGHQDLTLALSDDGIGIPDKPADGMGLRTMAYRASVIGATFKVERMPSGGTSVICVLPAGNFRVKKI